MIGKAAPGGRRARGGLLTPDGSPGRSRRERFRGRGPLVYPGPSVSSGPSGTADIVITIGERQRLWSFTIIDAGVEEKEKKLTCHSHGVSRQLHFLPNRWIRGEKKTRLSPFDSSGRLIRAGRRGPANGKATVRIPCVPFSRIQAHRCLRGSKPDSSPAHKCNYVTAGARAVRSRNSI